MLKTKLRVCLYFIYSINEVEDRSNMSRPSRDQSPEISNLWLTAVLKIWRKNTTVTSNYSKKVLGYYQTHEWIEQYNVIPRDRHLFYGEKIIYFYILIKAIKKKLEEHGQFLVSSSKNKLNWTYIFKKRGNPSFLSFGKTSIKLCAFHDTKAIAWGLTTKIWHKNRQTLLLQSIFALPLKEKNCFAIFVRKIF